MSSYEERQAEYESDSAQGGTSDEEASSEYEEDEESSESGDSSYVEDNEPVIDHYLPDGVRDLWEKEQLFDYTIRVKGKWFHLHKVILASYSDSFQDMIKENKNSAKVEGLTAAAMEQVIQFMYSNTLEVTKKNVEEILAAAKYFRIQAAIDMCTRYKSNTQGSESEGENPLAAGIEALWEEDLLVDFVINVEGERFPVHKVIMAAMSGYFRDMLTSDTAEGQGNCVTIKELCAETVESLIEFIYTNNLDIITQSEDVAELLTGAAYLRIKMATDVCSKFMVCQINEDNWLDTFQRIRAFGPKAALDDVKIYIRMYMAQIVETCDFIELMYEDLCFLIENWQQSEYDLFLFIRKWVNTDLQRSKQLQNDLLCRVRYGLMSPNDLGKIQGMKDYVKNSQSSWCQLIQSAVRYHKLPLHKRIPDCSDQTQVRGDPTFVLFSSGHSESGGFVYEPHREKTFVKQIGIKAPEGLEMTMTHMEMNNFLIVLFFVETQDYLENGRSSERCLRIFDPRTRQWGSMANLPDDLCPLTMTHDNKYIYAPGGLTDGWQIIDRVDRYDFQSNSWSPFGRLAVPIFGHATCVVSDGLYVTGGFTENVDDDDLETSCLTRMDRLDLSTRKWQQRAPMLEGRYDHFMHPITILGEESVCIIEYKMALQYYSPSKDQWFKCPFVFNTPPPQMEHHALVRGNRVYLTNTCTDSHSSNDARIAIVSYSETNREAVVEYLLPRLGLLGIFAKLSVLSIRPNAQPIPVP